MKKRGFTLIELLAVIIILAIIALIATPIVMRVIENSKKGAAERSAENYVKAVETIIVTERMNGNSIEDGIYTIDSNGDICLDEDCANKLIITMTGTKPSSGKVKIEGEKVIGYSVIIGEYKNKYGNYSILPSEYQEVEYLESTGTQYIQTNISAATLKWFYIQAVITDINSYDIIIGVSYDDNKNSFSLQFNNFNQRAVFRWGNIENYGYIVSLGTFYELELGVGHLKINNYTSTAPTSMVSDTRNIVIFGNYTNRTSTSVNTMYLFRGKIYKCELYGMSDDLIGNFIPCYRKSDSKPGMYDTVNHVFYTNQGSDDDFIVGDDVD